ncbi:uncharacterized protein LOC131227262 isoform X4 [Magnolia sinica]|uniref:uncharacterized protein LOC131227262 isoform X4 n=1 Tax=Magnolia sinica TaxID=86752 RepID=UPI0026595CB1|nr:uncharacterized protein LOC131227262 isoform X4 [Magnolia sinica]
MRSMLTRMPMNPDVSVLLAGLYRVGLAKILDLYYEDLYTLPNKQSSSGLVSEISKLSKKELFIIANAIYYICWWMFSGSHWYSCSTLLPNEAAASFLNSIIHANNVEQWK